MSDPLKAFAREVIQQLAFEGGDGGEVVQELALKHGLLRQEEYERTKHLGLVGDDYDEGDPICVFTELLA